MTNVWTITWRELKTYFVSPLAYILSAVWLVMSGYFFTLNVNYRDASMRNIFPTLIFLFWILAPLLTMRLLAEEQRMGTLELLLTAPLHDWQVVIGKFLGNLIWYATLVILPMLSYVVVLIRYGSPDYGPLVTGYLGLLLLGAACFSIGLFTSSLTQNQVVAAILSMVILIFLWIADSVSSFAGPGMVSDIGTYLSITRHYNDFFNGVVNSTDIIYTLSVVAISLFLATQTLQSRRWR
jgi:ABC-2 type transport system permease protein